MRSGIEALPQSLRAVRIHNSLRMCMYSCIGIHIYAHFRAWEGGDVDATGAENHRKNLKLRRVRDEDENEHVTVDTVIKINTLKSISNQNWICLLFYYIWLYS